MKFIELSEFERDLKKLLKRFRTLEDDLKVVKQVLAVAPDARPPFSYEIDGLGLSTCVIKAKKIACKSLKGKGNNTGLRLVDALFELEWKIILFELSYKGDTEIEDRERIFKHLK